MKKLSKEEMKKVMGGVEDSGGGSRCVVYCCNAAGTCGAGTTLPGVTSCSSNEDCQSQAGSGGNNTSCPSGWYVAALCKGGTISIPVAV